MSEVRFPTGTTESFRVMCSLVYYLSLVITVNLNVNALQTREVLSLLSTPASSSYCIDSIHCIMLRYSPIIKDSMSMRGGSVCTHIANILKDMTRIGNNGILSEINCLSAS